MLLSTSCPKCGKNRDYLAEEIGKSAHCMQCGEAFLLKENNKQMSKNVLYGAAAALASTVLIGGGLLIRAEFNRDVMKLHDRLVEAERQAIQEAERQILKDIKDDDK